MNKKRALKKTNHWWWEQAQNRERQINRAVSWIESTASYCQEEMEAAAEEGNFGEAQMLQSRMYGIRDTLHALKDFLQIED